VAEATGQAARSFKLYDKCKRASEVALTRMNLETMERVFFGWTAAKSTNEKPVTCAETGASRRRLHWLVLPQCA
jgi:hypothetical protein